MESNQEEDVKADVVSLKPDEDFIAETILKYENVMAQENLLKMVHDDKVSRIMAPIQAEIDRLMKDVQPELDAENLEYETLVKDVSKDKESIEKDLRNLTLLCKTTLKGSKWSCEYVKGGYKVKNWEGLIEYARLHSHVATFYEATPATTRIKMKEK